jgi:hypothetical protein
VPGHRGQGSAERASVERVDPVQAAADPDDLPAEVVHQRRVVRFGVAEDQYLGATGDRPGDQALHQGGFAGAGLAQDEHPGVGDQPSAEPGQRVQARYLAPQLVPAHRGPGGRGAAAGHEGKQPAELGGSALELRARADLDGPAAVADLPSPGWRERRRARHGRPPRTMAPPDRAANSRTRGGREHGWGSAAGPLAWLVVDFAYRGLLPRSAPLGGCAGPFGVGGVRHEGSLSAGSGGRVRAGRCRTGGWR